MNTAEVENFLGFPTGIQGPELMENLRGQAERFGAELVPDDVVAVRLTGEVKEVDTGDEEATFLTRFARSVTLVHRQDCLRASKIMQQRAFNDSKLKLLWDTEVLDVLDEQKMTGLSVRNLKTGDVSTLDLTGMFVAIGHDPRIELFGGQLALDEEGYVAVQGRTARTNVPGVFACGDVVDHEYRQAITAAVTAAAVTAAAVSA